MKFPDHFFSTPDRFTITVPNRSSQATKKPEPAWQEVKPQLLQTAGQKQGEQWYRDQLSANTGYQQPMSAKNEYADQIRSNLSSYLSRATPQEYGLAGEEYRKTLQNEYNPADSQYYQGTRQAMDMNLSDALNRYGRESYLKGNLRSTATDTGQARLLAEDAARRNQILGQLALQERQNRLSAAGSSVGLGQIYDAREADKQKTLMGTSDYLRQVQQQELDRNYQEFLRQQNRQQSLADSLYKTPVTYAYPQYRLV